MSAATTTPLLSLPLLAAAQAQKHVTHNEALIRLDALAQTVVPGPPSNTPPAAPAEGEVYLVGLSPTGAWVGRTGQIAQWLDQAWTFLMPRQGWSASVAAGGHRLFYDGTTWRDAPARTAEQLGINTTPSSSDRLSVASSATLLTHAGTGHQLKINKASATATASILFQTGFSGRAEVGITGSDNLMVRTSSDGTTWRDVITVDRSTGRTGVGTNAPTAALDVVGPGNSRIFGMSAGPVGMSYSVFGTASFLWHSGSILYLGTDTAHDLALGTANAEKMRVTATGQVGIGTPSPSAPLHVAGAIRVGQVAKAALPAAATVGAGALLHVTDEVGGAVLAFSDGSAWRRVTDRAVVA